MLPCMFVSLYCRPVIVSIEDDRDYQADMVLATLLDDLSHPAETASASTATSFSNTTANTTSAQRLAQPSTVSARLLGQKAAPRIKEDTGMLDDNQEDSAARDTRVTRTLGLGGRHINQHPGRSDVPGSSSSQSATFPSGAEYRQTDLNIPKRYSGGIAEVRHISQPSQLNTDALGRCSVVAAQPSQLMETAAIGGHVPQPSQLNTARSSAIAAQPSQLNTDALERSTAVAAHVPQPPQLSIGRSSAVTRVCHVPEPPQLMETDAIGSDVSTGVDLDIDEEDLMDALFGEDSMDGAVAEGGDMFGFDGAQKEEQRQSTKPPGDEEEEEEDGSIQISNLNESNFLPGTPPSKKVSSVSTMS